MIQNKVIIGRGEMVDFQSGYTTINETPGHKCNASQVFLLSYNPETKEALYDYAIYYSVEVPDVKSVKEQVVKKVEEVKLVM